MSLTLTSLIRTADPDATARRVGERLVVLVAQLPADGWLDWQVDAPRARRVTMSVSAGPGMTLPDLEWALEDVAVTSRRAAGPPRAPQRPVAELRVRATRGSVPGGAGFGSPVSARTPPVLWPAVGRPANAELVGALRACGATLRVTLRPADPQSAELLRTQAQQQWPVGGTNELTAYVGQPVQARVLVATDDPPPARLRAVLDGQVPGSELVPVAVSDDAVGHVLPATLASLMTCVVAAGAAPIPGVRTTEPAARQHPAVNDEPRGERIRLGIATTTAGSPRPVHLALGDAVRHVQVTGQTGTGKSTLLTGLALRAAAAGRGVTLVDPHGATVDRVLDLLDDETAARTLVVRFGDLDNRVPVSPWSTDDPEDAEPEIYALTDQLRALFDPRSEGIVGPRWERWFNLNAKAAIALLGRRASLHAISILARDQETIRSLAAAIRASHPEISSQLLAEYGHLGQEQAGDMASWAISKLGRLLGTPHLRQALATGANALHLRRLIDTVLLVDLGMPAMGTAAARTLGMLLLQHLWSAATARTSRGDEHLLLLDEAHLFQHGPLPAMLAEGRKFGLGVVAAHQHEAQLGPEVRLSLEANAASLLAFRASPTDAPREAARLGLGRPEDLTRLPALHAVTSLCVAGAPTAPFTLRVDRPARAGSARPGLVAEVVARSRTELVVPYEQLTVLDAAELHALLRRARRRSDDPAVHRGGSLLDEWLARRAAIVPDGAEGDHPAAEIAAELEPEADVASS